MKNSNQNAISTLKSGFIFIQHSDQLPPSYRVTYLGGEGYIGKLDSDHPNGFEPVTYQEYIEL